MYVCVCNGVTDHQIRDAVSFGIRTFEDLSSALGVATCCGRCTSCARQVLAEAIEGSTASAVAATRAGAIGGTMACAAGDD